MLTPGGVCAVFLCCSQLSRRTTRNVIPFVPRYQWQRQNGLVLDPDRDFHATRTDDDIDLIVLDRQGIQLLLAIDEPEVCFAFQPEAEGLVASLTLEQQVGLQIHAGPGATPLVQLAVNPVMKFSFRPGKRRS